MTRSTRVLLVDDHPLVLAGVKSALRATDDILVAGEATTGAAAVRASEECRPDVVLLDLQLPDMDGVSVLLEIKRRHPCKVIVLTCHQEERFVRMAMDSGADGYLTKSAEPAELIAAVRSAGEGGVPLSPVAASGVVSAMRGASRPQRPHLTPREREVWRLMADGASNAEIAESLFITEHTVKFHVGHILAKLGFKNRAEAICAAFRRGLAD